MGGWEGGRERFNPLIQHTHSHTHTHTHPIERSPDFTFTNPIRLVTNGSVLTTNEGTIEIYHNGSWGTICDDYWGYTEAVVACHMLGFATAVRAYSRYVQCTVEPL